MQGRGGRGRGEGVKGGGVKLRRTLTQSLTLVSNIPILLHICTKYLYVKSYFMAKKVIMQLSS